MLTTGKQILKNRLRLGGVLLPLILFITCPLAEVSAASKKTILFLGDSLTEGFGVEKNQSFPALFDKKLKEEGFLKVKVVNAGIGGSTSASARSRLNWFLRSKPDIIVLALGGNDGLRGLSTSEMKKNLAATIRLALSNHITVVLAGMKIPPNYGKKYTKDFEQVFPALAKEFSIPLIPFLLDGVAGERDLNLPDGIHPNPEGHKLIVQTVWKYLHPLLR